VGRSGGLGVLVWADECLLNVVFGGCVSLCVGTVVRG
jgi:hypothetical protein